MKKNSDFINFYKSQSEIEDIDKYINEIIPINKETPFTNLGFLKSTHISYQVYLF